jgi:SAM-dependent methyltransferase
VILTVSESHSSYDPAYFQPLFAIEDRHFWFQARNRAIATLVRQIATDWNPGYRVLEVGCGTGNVLQALENVCLHGQVVGMDLFSEGLQYARRRVSCALVQGDIQAPPFGAGFQLIGLFDVLEHLPDDRQVLRCLHALLADEGKLVLTVPAHPALWSYFDQASQHCRRYPLDGLAQKLLDEGYRIEYLSEYMVAIYPLVWLGRRIAALTGRLFHKEQRTYALATNELRIIPLVNEFLGWLLSLEIRGLARRRQLPLGTSIIAIACKHPS